MEMPWLYLQNEDSNRRRAYCIEHQALPVFMRQERSQMKKTISSVTLLALSSSAALADTSLSVGLQLADAQLTTSTYACGEAPSIEVRYVLSGAESLALVPVEGEQRIFVQVVAASGARYVSGQYEWWVKGDDGVLTDLIAEDTLMTCEAES